MSPRPTPAPAPAPRTSGPPTPGPRTPGPAAPGPTWHGVRTVARLELRQRLRSTRWKVALGVWVAVLLGVTVLIGVASGLLASEEDREQAGGLVLSFLVLMVLGMGLLVSPALAATAVNGDRAAGTLAPLQVTLLGPLEIALGKLLAAWAASLVLLASAVPFLLWGYLQGGSPAGRVITAVVLTAVVQLVVCAIGLGWSAVCARTASSSVLTYVSVASLCLLSPILFGLTTPLVIDEERVTVRQQDYSGAALQFDDQGDLVGEEPPCVESEVVEQVVHTERNWWLLALSPFVVVADAAPTARSADGTTLLDPLGLVREGVRTARLGADDDVRDRCSTATEDYAASERERLAALDALPAAWPWGLAANLLIGAAGVAVATRRLRVPYGPLPSGTRVA